jgi:hypothetical protein
LLSNVDYIAFSFRVLHHTQVELIPVAQSLEYLLVAYASLFIYNVEFVLNANRE